MSPPYNGLDISNHQKGLDLSRLPKLDVAIFKASQGTGYPDAYFEGFMRQAINLGIPRTGGYWWVETHQDVKAQLDVYLRKVEPFLKHPGFRLFVDWEPRNPERVGTAVEAVSSLKAATGAQPHIYMNRSTANTYRWQPIRDLGCHLWAAQYPNKDIVRGFKSDPWFQKPSGWDGRIAGLQYTDTGRLPGWNKKLDLDLFWYWPEGGTDQAGTPPEETKVIVPSIPVIRESDPPVHFYHHHGGRVNKSNGQPRLGCVCMAMTFPLIEREMLKRGLIRHQIDVFQGGYNVGGVAASAGTHDMGGVIDVAQGITLAQREVWAMFGVMMAPRIPAYGWRTGDHGHGGWHGCNHRTGSLAAQVRNMMNGYDGLVSNIRRNFTAPSRTWQEAYREYAAETITIQQEEEEPMATAQVRPVTIHHPGGEHPVLPGDAHKALDTTATAVTGVARATLTAPDGVKLRTRWVSWSGRDDVGWVRDTILDHATNSVETTAIIDQAWGGADFQLDVYADRECDIDLVLSSLTTPKR